MGQTDMRMQTITIKNFIQRQANNNNYLTDHLGELMHRVS